MKKLQNFSIALLAGSAMLLTACASNPPDPSLLRQAESAIERAVQAGAEEHAPVELRFARERFDFAKRVALPREDYELATWRIREAELNAQLAYVKTQAELARIDEDRAAADVASLKEDIRATFGEEALQ